MNLGYHIKTQKVIGKEVILVADETTVSKSGIQTVRRNGLHLISKLKDRGSIS